MRNQVYAQDYTDGHLYEIVFDSGNKFMTVANGDRWNHVEHYYFPEDKWKPEYKAEDPGRSCSGVAEVIDHGKWQNGSS